MTTETGSRAGRGLAGGVLAALVFVAGCAPRDAGFSRVRTLADERLGVDVTWEHLDGEQSGRLAELLRTPMGPGEAVQVALLASPALQADLERLGVARGNLVEASLFPNPELEYVERFGPEEPRPELDLGGHQSITGMLYTPLRRAAALAELDAAQSEAAARIVTLAGEAAGALYGYVAARQTAELAEQVAEALAASYEAARLIHRAGNSSLLEFSREELAYEQARMALVEAAGEVVRRREAVNELLGLWGPAAASWEAMGRLSPLPAEELELEDCERRAVEANLGLAALSARYTAAAQRANLSVAEGLLPEVGVGISAERVGGEWEVGPAFTAEIPLFDQGLGRIGRARAEARMIAHRHADQAVRVRAAARVAVSDLRLARERVRWHQEAALPLQQVILDEAMGEYNGMFLGVFELLQIQRDQITLGQSYVASLQAYWRARTRLEVLLAGGLLDGESMVSISTGSSPSQTQGGH